jgi:DnaJ-class molecular chaperone
MTVIKAILRRATCPRCGGSGGHSDFGNWVNCSACNGTGNK